MANSGPFAITKVNKYPKATLRWVDYMYGEEGSLLFRMGMEGKHYTKLPDGSLRFVEEIIKILRD